MQYDALQLAVHEEVAKGKGNIAVQATAGSGKTTTILGALNRVPRFKRTVFLSFSKAIVEELKARVPAHVRACTLHSLGCRFVLNKFKGVRIEEDKYFKKALANIPKKEVNKDAFKKCYRIQDICNYARMTLTPFEQQPFRDMCNYFSIDWDVETIEEAISLLKEYTKLKSLTVIDFTDMIYLPAVYPDELVNDKFDYIFLDEAQDTNRCQLQFIEQIQKPGCRLISVGDHRQCQPKGTKVLLSNGEYKVIEKLKVGDKIIGYNISDGSGYKKTPIVEKIQKRRFDGYLTVIESENNISKYTPEHICLARFNPKYQNCQALYLMERNGYFRIGITSLWGHRNNSVTMRARQENADKFWILKVYEDKRQAFLDEQYYSYSYGIPQLRFKDNYTGLYYQQELDQLWGRFSKDGLKFNAEALLNIFNRDIHYPLWERGKSNYFSKNHIRPINACNLIAKYMQVVVYDKNFKQKIFRGARIGLKYCDFKLKYEQYTGYVYSLQVSHYQNYVGDNILTHNCIYSFAGNDIYSFQRITERPNTKALPLTVSYRVPRKGVELAQTIYPDDIQAHPNAIEGVVRQGSEGEIAPGDMVICRNTKPLISLFFNLIERGIKSYVVGKDLEKGLAQLAEGIATNDKKKTVENAYKKLDTLHDELVELGIVNPTSHPKYISMQERIEIVLLILNKLEKAVDLVDKIHEIFHEDKKSVKLLSVHRSKGMECDRVFFIERYNGEKLCPSKWAIQDWEKLQERNLLFVAYTRFKKEFVFLNYED